MQRIYETIHTNNFEISVKYDWIANSRVRGLLIAHGKLFLLAFSFVKEKSRKFYILNRYLAFVNELCIKLQLYRALSTITGAAERALASVCPHTCQHALWIDWKYIYFIGILSDWQLFGSARMWGCNIYYESMF